MAYTDQQTGEYIFWDETRAPRTHRRNRTPEERWPDISPDVRKIRVETINFLGDDRHPEVIYFRSLPAFWRKTMGKKKMPTQDAQARHALDHLGAFLSFLQHTHSRINT